MKLSDFIAEFLATHGIRHVFGVTGGCIVHTIDSIAKRHDIKYIPVQHEQSAAMAADAYARVTGRIGAALATSGPGATNLLTGVCCSYYDSIPTIIITGQVPTGQLKRDSKSRQIGFQETGVIDIFQSVTKYSVLIDNSKQIRYELEKALYLACSGRPGPVLLDVCDDVQRAEIHPEDLAPFVPPPAPVNPQFVANAAARCLKFLSEAQRPVLIPGGGIRLAGAVGLFREFVEKLDVPCVPTWAAVDYIRFTDPKNVGTFGVSSDRAGNFAVQNADLVIALGTRLDTHETGPRVDTFARGARKVVVDLDASELEKFSKSGMTVDLPVCADVREFLTAIIPHLTHLPKPDRSAWLKRIAHWKGRYPKCLPRHRDQKERVNPYFFMEVLSQEIASNAVLITDCGGNLIWTMQGFTVTGEQRVISAFNNSPMGYAVPASMGAAFAIDTPIVCITGDGGCQMNIQELATIVYYKLPVKIFLINNHGHGIIRQTLDTWLQSRYCGINDDTGLAMPDLVKIAEAYGLETMTIAGHSDMRESIRIALRKPGAVFCNVELLQTQTMEPKLVFGRPIEDSAPLLDRDEFRANMIVPPIQDESRNIEPPILHDRKRVTSEDEKEGPLD